jgi:phage recombination protein Bet
MATQFGMDRAVFEQTLKATIMPKDATNEQTAAFLIVCREHRLNPFTKEIFAFPARGGIQPIVSIDGWMKLINSHPDFDGLEFKDELDTEGNLIAITAKIFRKSRSHPVSVTEYMSECRRATDTWKQYPARMLRHKAAIQAARYAFGFAGIYDPDEGERIVESRIVSNGEAAATLTVTDERKRKHDEAFEQYGDSIAIIKQQIARFDETAEADALWVVAETWGGIPTAAQMDLWLAPSKGGSLTTHERTIIKNHLPREETPL